MPSISLFPSFLYALALKELPQSITANVIYVKEENPPKGLEPIERFLMTNDEVDSAGQAFEKVKYLYRDGRQEGFTMC
jgi:hypothetical protein